MLILDSILFGNHSDKPVSAVQVSVCFGKLSLDKYFLKVYFFISKK